MSAKNTLKPKIPDTRCNLWTWGAAQLAGFARQQFTFNL